MDLPGIGSTVCLDLLTTSRLPEIAEPISNITCHMFIHMPPYATIRLCQANQWLSWGDVCCHISVSSCRLFFSRAHAVPSSLLFSGQSSSHRSSERIVHLQPNEMGTNSNHIIIIISYIIYCTIYTYTVVKLMPGVSK